MYTAHLAGNTSGISKSSYWLNYTWFDVCHVLPGNKDAMMPNPLMEEESCHVYNCDDERFSGSTKCWIFKVCGIESLKPVQEFYTPVCYCGDISTPINMTSHKMKRDWLLYLWVIWLLGRPLAIKSGRQSEGLATKVQQDCIYLIKNIVKTLILWNSMAILNFSI